MVGRTAVPLLWAVVMSLSEVCLQPSLNLQRSSADDDPPAEKASDCTGQALILECLKQLLHNWGQHNAGCVTDNHGGL